MRTLSGLSLLLSVPCILGHTGHEGPSAGESMQQYAQRHMSTEHHIDTFDASSFHKLHDLNSDGLWDRAEIEAVYGVHHAYTKKKFKDAAELQKKAEYIVNNVLERMDLDGDSKISAEELEKAGLDALPNFENMGAEGHHYDVESEFFLHHEEQFHSTPETQTDQSYNHPEDIEHFSQHEAIEQEEAEREARFQGVPVEEILQNQRSAEAPKEDEPSPNAIPKVTRVLPPEKQDPSIRFKSAVEEGRKKGEWGTGEEGFKPPIDASDRMRKGLPYKYKFRRNWGDF